MAPGAVLVVVAVLAWRFVGEQPFGMTNDNSAQAVQFALALAIIGVLGWGLWLQRQGRPAWRQLLRDRLLVVLGLCCFIGYFNFGRLHFGNFVHIWDTYHYYMGAKYFPEAGYDRMYDCAIVANAENGRRDEVNRAKYTDLRTNIVVETFDLMKHPERCKATFSDARWAEYKKDIATFRGMVNEQRWRDIHMDHGYNATPVWTLAGYWLSNSGAVTKQTLKNLNMIDPVYLFFTVLIVWWAFGPRAFAIAAMALGCHFANRYYWTGGAFLRHDWIFYFVASICLLKKNYPALAGAAFAYAVLLRLFPGLAAAGAAVAAFEYWRRNRKLDPVFLRYVLAGVVTAVVLVGASFRFGGPGVWRDFAQNTIKHANTPLTNHMGLRTIISWDPNSIGAKTIRRGTLDSWSHWKETRVENWNTRKPLMWLAFAASMYLVWLALKRQGPDLYFGAALGTGFIVIGAELTNYYYCFLMGIAVLHQQRREVGLILASLCAVSHLINWRLFPWMSGWLDEQYVTMSAASVLAVAGIWWLFTKYADDAVAPDEGPVMLTENDAHRARAADKPAKKKRR